MIMISISNHQSFGLQIRRRKGTAAFVLAAIAFTCPAIISAGDQEAVALEKMVITGRNVHGVVRSPPASVTVLS